MKAHKIPITVLLAAISIFLYGCSFSDTNQKSNFLTTSKLIGITLSAPEGSGAIRTLSLSYIQDGDKKNDVLDSIRRIDCEGYDGEAGEQSFTKSDNNQDGIVDIVVYREFWFPDIDVAHAEMPEWPIVYEYDVQKGFVTASSKHKEVFLKYIESSKNQLSTEAAQMSDNAILALKRLIYAAEHVVDGSFIPQSPYQNLFYQDVYTLTKGMN